MATVTNTDYVANFAGVGDTNPYTVTGVTEIDAATNNVELLSGAIRNTDPIGTGTEVLWRLRKDGTATATTLRASVEMDGTGSYNRKGPAILTATGQGYALLSSFNSFLSLYEFGADGVITTAHVEDFEVTGFSEGTRLHLEYTPGTGALRSYVESTLITDLNVTDSTYTTGIMPGFAMHGADGAMEGFISIGADYLSAASGIPTAWLRA